MKEGEKSGRYKVWEGAESMGKSEYEFRKGRKCRDVMMFGKKWNAWEKRNEVIKGYQRTVIYIFFSILKRKKKHGWPFLILFHLKNKTKQKKTEVDFSYTISS